MTTRLPDCLTARFLKFAVLLSCGLVVLWSCSFAEGAEVYPQVDISGYKKFEHKEVSVTPLQNYTLGITHLGGYTPLYSGGPWQERLQLSIVGALSEKLSVTYDIEQQPEYTDKYDVKVKYDQAELAFGDLTANFSGNEFASVSKSINGVMFTFKSPRLEITAVPSAKLKSQTQSVSVIKGNNTRGPYSLGHGTIVEGSEQITINNIPQVRGVDYTIDYFEGKATFNRILSLTDEIKYSFDYSNILDLFFPTLSKRDFIGFQGRAKLVPGFLKSKTPEIKLITHNQTEVFPKTETSISSEAIATPEAKTFQLKNFPVEVFSEVITFEGRVLKRLEDYTINYDKGTLALYTSNAPAAFEPLTIAYNYHDVSAESESLSGINSPGPYTLLNSNILTESEKVKVDGKIMLKDLQYAIDYKNGRVTFVSSVPETSLIKVDYIYKQLIPASAEAEENLPLTVGATYLKESAKKSTGAPTATIRESVRATDVINNSNLISVDHYPLLPTAEGGTLSLTINGQDTTAEVDYVVPLTRTDPATGHTIVTPEAVLDFVNDHFDTSNGYNTGTIKVLRTITATDEIVITYTYKKSTVGKFNGAGTGSKGPYYLTNVRNIVPGTEQIQVWEQGSSIITQHNRNSSFEANAGATGYSINYSENNPYITFNENLASSKNFSVTYQYIAQTASVGQNLDHDIIGADFGLNIGKFLQVDSAIAKSTIDQVNITVSTSETIRPTSSTKTIALSNKGQIVDGTDKVFVNEKALNRDLDYFINYGTETTFGSITFYYLTVTNADTISVQYEYQDPTGGIERGIEARQGVAYRIGTNSEWGPFNLKSIYKDIDAKFRPLGGTSIGKGSIYKEAEGSFSPSSRLKIVSNYKETHEQIGTYTGFFTRGKDLTLSTNVNPGDLVLFNVNYRKYLTEDDLTPANNATQNTWDFGITPVEIKRGRIGFEQKYEYRQIASENLNSGPTLTNIEYLHTLHKLSLTDNVKLGYDYQYSIPITTLAGNTTAHSVSRDNTYDLTLDVPIPRIQKFYTNLKHIIHNGTDFISGINTSTQNTSWHSDLVPISALSLSYDRNKQENIGATTALGNPKNEREAANIKITPPNTTVNLNLSNDNTLQENGASRIGTNNNSGVEYTPPLPGALSVFKPVVKYNEQTSKTNVAASVGATAIETNTKSKLYGGGLAFSPLSFVTLGGEYNLEDYENANNDSVSPVNTKTQNTIYKITTNIRPSFINLPSFSFDGMDLSYIEKKTNNLVGSQEAGRKRNANAKANFQMFGWGTLSPEYDRERNEGEVQGGIFTPYNLDKDTLALNFTFNIPIGAAVPESISFKASWKRVIYNDNIAPANNFTASLLGFDGTLNF